MPGRLEGKVCVITGAASGIGADLGADVRRRGRAGGRRRPQPERGRASSRSRPTSPTRTRSRALYARVVDELGHIDVLFNNAGINPYDDTSVVEEPLDAWQRVQEVNVRSVFLCCKYGIRHLLETGGGSVINTASFVAVMGAAVSQISYTASKGAVLAMSREMGVEFARRGVRVNALCPGPVNTPLLQELFASDPAKAARRLVHLPMGRFAEAERDRQRRDLPRVRRVLLRHGLDLHGRRRPLGRLSHAGDGRVAGLDSREGVHVGRHPGIELAVAVVQLE